MHNITEILQRVDAAKTMQRGFKLLYDALEKAEYTKEEYDLIIDMLPLYSMTPHIVRLAEYTEQHCKHNHTSDS